MTNQEFEDKTTRNLDNCVFVSCPVIVADLLNYDDHMITSLDRENLIKLIRLVLV